MGSPVARMRFAWPDHQELIGVQTLVAQLAEPRPGPSTGAQLADLVLTALLLPNIESRAVDALPHASRTAVPLLDPPSSVGDLLVANPRALYRPVTWVLGQFVRTSKPHIGLKLVTQVTSARLAPKYGIMHAGLGRPVGCVSGEIVLEYNV